MVITLHDRALTLYIKYCTDNMLASLVETKAVLKNEFSKPKSNLHLVIGFKKITMNASETPWRLDQWLKCVIREANMQLMDGQHRDWFIASLLPHLRISLSQQNIGT